MRLAQEAFIGDDAGHRTLQVMKFDGDPLGLLALGQPDRVCAQLQIGTEGALVLGATRLVVDNSRHAVETRVDSVEPSGDVGVVEADADGLLDAGDVRVGPTGGADIAAQLLVTVRAELRMTSLRPSRLVPCGMPYTCHGVSGDRLAGHPLRGRGAEHLVDHGAVPAPHVGAHGEMPPAQIVVSTRAAAEHAEVRYGDGQALEHRCPGSPRRTDRDRAVDRDLLAEDLTAK